MNAIDTSVLLYLYDRRDGNRLAQATRTLAGMRDGVLLWQVACEFLAGARKLPNFAAGTEWKRLIEIRAILPLVLPTPTVLDRARHLVSSHQLHFWDAMIFAACLEAGVTRLYSEDLPGELIAGLEIVNPFV